MVAWKGVWTPAAYPPEFRRRAVEVAPLRDKPISQLAKELGIADSGLRRWMAQADADEGHRPGLTSDERQDHAELRRRNRVLEIENNNILKRAAAYFATENVLQKFGSGASASLLPRGFPWL